MPLYEYQCDACGHRFERIQKFSDDLESTCPECGGPVRKLLSSPAIQFKGSGWYITDYARKGSQGSESTSSESKSDTSKKETKTSSDGGSSDTSTSKSSTNKSSTGSSTKS